MITVNRRILVLTAVAVEQEAVLRGLKKNMNVDVLLCGVGPIAAAANTAKLLATNSYKWVINAGIAGGFPQKAKLGTLVIGDEIIAADLGIETLEGFQFLEAMGFGLSKFYGNASLADELTQVLKEASFSVIKGSILTVSTATGTAESAAEMLRRVPGAIAEGMEGFGVAQAAHIFGIPTLEIRAISNEVGPRDKSAWKIKEALDVLEEAFSIWSDSGVFSDTQS